MKLKLSELKPNPFKKQISKGQLNKEQVDKIKANIKELGFFGSLPVFKKDNQFYLIAGHHRVQALKEVYGKDFQVEVVVSNYNEDQVFKGMVIENITQRTNDFMELNENIVAIENYLNSKKEILEALRESRKGSKHSPLLSEQKQLQQATSSDISFWIDKKTEEVISHDVITNNLNIFHKLDPELRKDIEKKHNKSREEREEDNLNQTQAVLLSGIEGYDEQNKLKKVLNKSREQRVREQAKLITQYKEAPEPVKEQVKKGNVDLADISLAITQHNIKQKKGEPRVENIEKKINGLIDRLSFSISDSETKLKGVIKDIALLSPFVNDMDEKQKARVGMKLQNFGKLLSQASDLMEKIEDKI